MCTYMPPGTNETNSSDTSEMDAHDTSEMNILNAGKVNTLSLLWVLSLKSHISN